MNNKKKISIALIILEIVIMSICIFEGINLTASIAIIALVIMVHMYIMQVVEVVEDVEYIEEEEVE